MTDISVLGELSLQSSRFRVKSCFNLFRSKI